MDIQTLGIGIIGMGFMGKAFAQICTQLANATLVGVTDAVPGVGLSAAEQFTTRHFATVTDLVSHPDVQAIIVATAEDAHVEASVMALQKGKSVLVEKPIANTVAEAQKIVDAAQTSESVLMVGHVLRFSTSFATIKQMVADGKIGTVQYIFARRLNGKNAQDRLKGRCSLPVFLGVHDYDIVRWIANSEPVRVYAESQWGVLQKSGYQIEDSTWAMITFANGALAVCETGWILPNGHPAGADQLLIVQGSEGRLELDMLNQGIRLSTETRTIYPDITFMPWAHGELRGGFVHEVEHFVSAALTGSKPLITGQDGLIAMKMAEAIVASAATHTPVDMA